MVEYIAVVGLVALVALGSFRAFGTAVFGKTEYEAACIQNLDVDCKGGGNGSSNLPGASNNGNSNGNPSGDVEGLDPSPPVAAAAPPASPAGPSESSGSAAPPGQSGSGGATGTGAGAGAGAGSTAGSTAAASGKPAGASGKPAGAGPSAGAAPAANATSLAIAKTLVKPGGTGTAADALIVATELAKLPSNVLSSMKKDGIQVIAAKGSVTDYFAELKGVRPRGWPPGSGWDNVPGLARGKTVVIAVRNGRVPPTGDGHGASNLVFHETFHAIDSAGNGKSKDPTFVAARSKDVAKLQPYFQQPGDAGLSETFAESAAKYYGNDPSQTPNLKNYWRENEGRIFPRKPP